MVIYLNPGFNAANFGFTCFALFTSYSMSSPLTKLLNNHLLFKTLSKDVALMETKEVDENFNYLCGKLCNAITQFDSLFIKPKSISQIIKFIHTNCMISDAGVIINSDKDIMFMLECLDIFYVVNKKNCNIFSLIYYSILKIHPYNVGNHYCALILIAILKNKYICKVKTQQQRSLLRKNLLKMLINDDSFLNEKANIFSLNQLLLI